MKRNLVTILVGFLVALAAWVPLWIVEANDRYAMPVGLGLLALAGSFVGGVTVLIGVVRLVLRMARSSKPSS